ncbi:MAG: GNAT family N-acetyltransferase [Planctomycetales bacterium]|nr:GNAT family N-acetyltransferase [Planctomycetales bacterium]
MSLTVELLTNVEHLSDEHVCLWNHFARNPLQRWEWLGSWWEAYKTQYDLCILAIKRQNQIIGFAPWCLESRIAAGRTIQFLGAGKACTDHLSLLVAAEDVDDVCTAIAKWLIHAGGPNPSDVPRQCVWDSIELIGVDQSDDAVNRLVCAMGEVGLEVQQSEGMGCYAIDLPETWDEYINLRSKSGRREVRQSIKSIDDGTIVVDRIRDHQRLNEFWDVFVNLHQRRRHAEGTTGCFDHPPFGTFLRTAASRLLNSGLLEFFVASVDGVPVATQFAISDAESWYFYQSGMEPDAADLRPGLSMFCYAIRDSIQSGRKRFDMMRGDEPYKLRWRAELLPAQEVRVCSPRTAAQVRRQIYRAGVTFKGLLKTGLGMGQHQH